MEQPTDNLHVAIYSGWTGFYLLFDKFVIQLHNQKWLGLL